VNGIHIQQIWIAGFVFGFLYDYEQEPFTDEHKNIVIICIGVLGIKIEWW
jgi:hypothetical protein